MGSVESLKYIKIVNKNIQKVKIHSISFLMIGGTKEANHF